MLPSSKISSRSYTDALFVCRKRFIVWVTSTTAVWHRVNYMI